MGWWKRKKPERISKPEAKVFSYNVSVSENVKTPVAYNDDSFVPVEFGKQSLVVKGYAEGFRLHLDTPKLPPRLTEHMLWQINQSVPPVVYQSAFERFLSDSVQVVGHMAIEEAITEMRRNSNFKNGDMLSEDGWEADEELSHCERGEESEENSRESWGNEKAGEERLEENVSMVSMEASERKSQLWEWATVGAEGKTAILDDPNSVHPESSSEAEKSGGETAVVFEELKSTQESTKEILPVHGEVDKSAFGSPVSLPQSSRQTSPEKGGVLRGAEEQKLSSENEPLKKKPVRCIWGKKGEENGGNGGENGENEEQIEEIMEEEKVRHRKVWNSEKCGVFPPGDNLFPQRKTPQILDSVFESLRETAAENNENSKEAEIPVSEKKTVESGGGESLSKKRLELEKNWKEGKLELSRATKLAKALREAMENLSRVHGTEEMPKSQISSGTNATEEMKEMEINSKEVDSPSEEIKVEISGLRDSIPPSEVDQSPQNSPEASKSHDEMNISSDEKPSDSQLKRQLNSWISQLDIGPMKIGPETPKIPLSLRAKKEDLVSPEILALRLQMDKLQVSSPRDRKKPQVSKFISQKIPQKSPKNALGTRLPLQHKTMKKPLSFGGVLNDENFDPKRRNSPTSSDPKRALQEGKMVKLSPSKGPNSLWIGSKSPLKHQKISPGKKKTSRVPTLPDIHEESFEFLEGKKGGDFGGSKLDFSEIKVEHKSGGVHRQRVFRRAIKSKLPKLWLASDTEDEGVSNPSWR